MNFEVRHLDCILGGMHFRNFQLLRVGVIIPSTLPPWIRLWPAIYQSMGTNKPIHTYWCPLPEHRFTAASLKGAGSVNLGVGYIYLYSQGYVFVH